MTEHTCTAEALNDLRQRYLAGGEWTRQELKDAIHTMIGQRLKDVQATGTGAKKTKAAPVSLDELLPGAEPLPMPPPKAIQEPEVPQATELKEPSPEEPKTPPTKEPSTDPKVGGFF